MSMFDELLAEDTLPDLPQAQSFARQALDRSLAAHAEQKRAVPSRTAEQAMEAAPPKRAGLSSLAWAGVGLVMLLLVAAVWVGGTLVSILLSA